MKKKYLLFIFGFTFMLHFSFAQGINVELTIKWITSRDSVNVDSIVSVPELHITYWNNTDSNYYFLKKSGSRNGLPQLPWGSMVQFSNEEDKFVNQNESTLSYSIHSGINYTVQIGSYPLYNDGWIIYNDTTNYEDETEIDYINDEIADIYQNMYSIRNSKKTYNKIFFMESEIENNNISCSVKDAFVFLRPNEVYIDIFNLIAFQKVGGNFTFQLGNEESFDYVLIKPIWDDNEERYIKQKIALPENISEYFLYKSKFISNKITMSF